MHNMDSILNGKALGILRIKDDSGLRVEIN